MCTMIDKATSKHVFQRHAGALPREGARHFGSASSQHHTASQRRRWAPPSRSYRTPKGREQQHQTRNPTPPTSVDACVQHVLDTLGELDIPDFHEEGYGRMYEWDRCGERGRHAHGAGFPPSQEINKRGKRQQSAHLVEAVEAVVHLLPQQLGAVALAGEALPPSLVGRCILISGCMYALYQKQNKNKKAYIVVSVENCPTGQERILFTHMSGGW